MELYWSLEIDDPGLDHNAEYDHLVLFSREIRDGGQRQKVAARSYQGRRGLQRGTPQVISQMQSMPNHASNFIPFSWPSSQSVAELMVSSARLSLLMIHLNYRPIDGCIMCCILII